MRQVLAKSSVVLLCASSLISLAQSAGIWLDVPFVKQSRNACGAASIAMVMQYWQLQQGKAPDASSDSEQIQRTLYSEKAHGIYASEMESYLQRQAFRTFVFGGEWKDLEQHLEKGRPLIVALRPTGDGALHYVVVVGVDNARQLVSVNDPAQRKLLQQERSEFEREWKGAGHWTLLAIPRAGA